MAIGKGAGVGWVLFVLLRLAFRLPILTVVSNILFGVTVCLSFS